MSVTSLHIGVLGAAKAPDSLFKGTAGSKSTDWSSLLGLDASALFGSQFASLLASAQGTTLDATSASSGDPQALLSRLVQQGTPISTIGRTIAQRVSDSVRTLLAGKLSKPDLDRLSTKLAQALTDALAPPGTAPPGTAAQEVATLAQRLTNVVNGLARAQKNGAGQQNEISGTFLDANSAKESPAQQKTNDASSELDVSSLVRSLLASAASALQSQTPHVIPQAAAAQSPQAPSSDDATASPSRISADSASSAITIANAPDLLARMLVRAAGADRAVNANAVTTSSVSVGATLPASDRGAQAPSAIAARLVTVLSSFAAGIASSDSSNANSGGGSSAREHTYLPFQQAQSVPSNAPGPMGIGAGVMPVTHLHTIVQQLQDTQGVKGRQADANAVIAQLVKGMVMRTNAQGDSEIRLRLQPENLGDVTMKITVQGSQISASVVAQNADVKSALVDNQQHLARALAESGLTLAGFSVDVSGGDAGRDQNRDRTSGFGRRYTVHELPGAAQSEPQSLAAIGPPLVSGSGLELFNYLA